MAYRFILGAWLWQEWADWQGLFLDTFTCCLFIYEKPHLCIRILHLLVLRPSFFFLFLCKSPDIQGLKATPKVLAAISFYQGLLPPIIWADAGLPPLQPIRLRLSQDLNTQPPDWHSGALPPSLLALMLTDNTVTAILLGITVKLLGHNLERRSKEMTLKG